MLAHAQQLALCKYPIASGVIFFSKAPCFVVGKEKYSISDNSQIVFLKFPVFLNILSTVTRFPSKL